MTITACTQYTACSKSNNNINIRSDSNIVVVFNTHTSVHRSNPSALAFWGRRSPFLPRNGKHKAASDVVVVVGTALCSYTTHVPPMGLCPRTSRSLDFGSSLCFQECFGIRKPILFVAFVSPSRIGRRSGEGGGGGGRKPSIGSARSFHPKKRERRERREREREREREVSDSRNSFKEEGRGPDPTYIVPHFFHKAREGRMHGRGFLWARKPTIIQSSAFKKCFTSLVYYTCYTRVIVGCSFFLFLTNKSRRRTLYLSDLRRLPISPEGGGPPLVNVTSMNDWGERAQTHRAAILLRLSVRAYCYVVSPSTHTHIFLGSERIVLGTAFSVSLPIVADGQRSIPFIELHI